MLTCWRRSTPSHNASGFRGNREPNLTDTRPPRGTRGGRHAETASAKGRRGSGG